MKTTYFRIVFCCVCLLNSIQFVKAQTLIHGKLIDESEKPMQFVNISLLRSPDSTFLQGMVSDSTGSYAFENINPGKYLLSYTLIGIKKVAPKLVEIEPGKHTTDLGLLKLEAANKQLVAVTIAARKPLIEQKIDRTVINVKGSITDVGGSALDILAKSPGVVVNSQNNTISVSGKNKVVVMINGKVTYLPTEAVVQLLAGTSAGNIEKIEIITTPPSKYDAEGNAGFINIVLLNNPNTGLNGSYFLTAGYGKKETPAAGANFNYRSGKVNLFGTYSYTRDHRLELWEIFREASNKGDVNSDETSSHRNAIYQVHNLRMGMDYQIDSANIIGALLSGYNTSFTMTANNISSLQKNSITDITINTLDYEINNWQNTISNLNFQHTFKKGKFLYLDANYVYYKDNNPNTYSNSYYNGTGNSLFEQDSRTGKTTPIHFKVFSGDYTTPSGKKAVMEAGVKVSSSQFKNDTYAQNFIADEWVNINGFSGQSLLKENIDAGFVSFTVDVNSKTTLKGGLRYEYTTSDLSSTKKTNNFNKKYGELFPTFYWSQKLNEDNSFNFSYNRRITRPAFNDLAPFTLFLDPKTYFTGNPALQPAIANTAQVSYLHKDLIFSLSYTHEDNAIGLYQNTVDTINNIQYISSFNFKYVQYVTASFSLPLNINSWWGMQNNFIGLLQQINTVDNGLPIRFGDANFNINTTQRFTLPKAFALEFTGFYQSGHYLGHRKGQPIYRVDIGFQKKFKNKRDVLRFAANDILNSGGHFQFIDNLASRGATIKGNYHYGLRAFRLTYTHNFGNNSLKDKRERLTGAEDELNRVK